MWPCFDFSEKTLEKTPAELSFALFRNLVLTHVKISFGCTYHRGSSSTPAFCPYRTGFFCAFPKLKAKKNSSPEKTQDNFGVKTQGTGAFSDNFPSKLKVPELFQSIFSEKIRYRTFFRQFSLKTQGLWSFLADFLSKTQL